MLIILSTKIYIFILDWHIKLILIGKQEIIEIEGLIF